MTEKKDSCVPLWFALLMDILAACLIIITFAFFNHGKDYLAGKIEAVWNIIVSSREVGFTELQSEIPDEEVSDEKTAEVLPTSAAESVDGETGYRQVQNETESDQSCIPVPEKTEKKDSEGSPSDASEEPDAEVVQIEAEDPGRLSEEADGSKLYRFEDMMSDSVVITETSYSSPNIHIDIYEYGSGEGFLETPYVIADIYVRDPHMIKTFFAGGSYDSGRSDVNTNTFLSAQCGALLSINGDYYVSQADSVVLRNGVLYREPMLDYDALALYEDGTMKVYESGDLVSQTQIEKAVENAWQIWSFGPSLLDSDGRRKSNLSNRSVGIESAHPRTAIGYYEPCHYCFVTVEGRVNYAHGATLADLAGLFEDLGCSAAYNLDGGGSSSMIFNGKMMGMFKSERYIPDIIYLKEPD